MWWKNNVRQVNNPIKISRFSREIFSDASRSGWGACWENKSSHGHWDVRERERHINYLELLSASSELKCFASDLRNCEILLRIDNTTAIAYVNRMGGIQILSLSKLAKQIWR